jgi:Proteasome subunit
VKSWQSAACDRTAVGNAATADDDANAASSAAAPPPVSMLLICDYLRNTVYKQNGGCQVSLLVGGMYENQALLPLISQDGTMMCETYTAQGSRGLAAYSVLKHGYSSSSEGSSSSSSTGSGSMSVEEGIRLAIATVKAGIDHGLGSGSQVDVCVIQNDRATYQRCALAEEVLRERTTVGAIQQNATASTGLLSVGGVNGFGMLPARCGSIIIHAGAATESKTATRGEARSMGRYSIDARVVYESWQLPT